MPNQSKFTQFANQAARIAGRSYTFAAAIAIIVLWALSGPIFKFNDTWQLVINTGTTIITFLMVFLIQNSQNRDTEAIHIKLDEIIRSIEEANNDFLDIENLEEKELDVYREEFKKLAEETRSTSRAVQQLREMHGLDADQGDDDSDS